MKVEAKNKNIIDGNENDFIPVKVVPDRKLKVFISSICGVPKYDSVRIKLKQTIEATCLAEAYTFEGKEASTLPAGLHYTWALEESDICIFLIDNSDGINPGVQAEIDTVKKRNIKALYYFCDEHSEEKTALEQSLIGARFAKSKTVHKFDDLIQDGARALINDIVDIYHYYCSGRFTCSTEDNNNDLAGIDTLQEENLHAQVIPKAVLKNIDKCVDYILEFVFGRSNVRFREGEENTSEIDEWCVQFLPVLFEGRSIKQFNVGMFLETLKEQQTDEYYQIVQQRWKAIQAYYMGDVEKCVAELETALKIAKESNQPSWVVKDILIDLRNKHWTLCEIKNCFKEPEAQKELTESGEELYYPILDRIHESLQEKYMAGLYKKKTESPYTVTFGNSFDQFGELLASSYVVSMYNGSLTHLLLFYKKLRDFLFYLSEKYDDWNFRRGLLKLAIYEGKEKEIKGIQNSYPEVLNRLSHEDAASIMDFSANHPIAHEKLKCQLLAFGTVGYYLDEECYKKIETLLISEIKAWLDGEQFIPMIGQGIFEGLTGVAYRMSQDTLAEICCSFMDKHYSRWYIEMFKFIANRIDLRKMTQASAEALLTHIVQVLDNEKEREQIKYSPTFLCVLRKQDYVMTEEMDRKVSEHMPSFYSEVYALETAKEEQLDLLTFVNQYVERISKSNKTQGAQGVYFEHGTRDIATVRCFLLEKEFKCDAAIMDSIIEASMETILTSKEDVRTKLDAVSLLSCIVLKFPKDYERNANIFKTLIENKNGIEILDDIILSSNIDGIALKIGLCFLEAAMGYDTVSELLELMPYIWDDIATTVTVEKTIIEYLEVTDEVTFPKEIDAIVLQNTLQWLQSDYIDVRWYAVRILFGLLRNPKNISVVNNQLIHLVDYESAYIKNLIMRQVYKTEGINDTTRDYIIMRCENDANFVVRMVCKEVTQN